MAVENIPSLAVIALLGILGARQPAFSQAITGIDAKGRSYEDLRVNQRRASLAMDRKMRSKEKTFAENVKKVSLKVRSEPCVAYLAAAHECALSIEAFNALIPTFIPRDRENNPLPITDSVAGSIRKKILDFALGKVFFENPDNPYLSHANSSPALDGEGKNTDAEIDSLARHLYSIHYAKVMRAYAKIDFEIYVSSDTNLINSLDRKFSERSDTSKMPWIPSRLAVSIAPEEFMKLLPGLRPGEWSRPVEIPEGRALIRIRKPPLSLSQLMPKMRLIALSWKNAIRKDEEKAAWEYYAGNIDRFQEPDTVDFKLRLLPLPAGMRLRMSASARANDDSLLASLAGTYPMVGLQSLGWTPQLKAALETRRDLQFDSAAPMIGWYGCLWVHVASHRRGKGTLPFQQVREDILNRIQDEALDSALVEADLVSRSKQAGKDFSLSYEAWIRELMHEVQPQEIEQPAARDSAWHPSPDMRAPSSTEADDPAYHSDALKRRLAEAKIQRIKEEWILENIKLTESW